MFTLGTSQSKTANIQTSTNLLPDLDKNALLNSASKPSTITSGILPINPLQEVGSTTFTSPLATSPRQDAKPTLDPALETDIQRMMAQEFNAYTTKPCVPVDGIKALRNLDATELNTLNTQYRALWDKHEAVKNVCEDLGVQDYDWSEIMPKAMKELGDISNVDDGVGSENSGSRDRQRLQY